MITLWYLIVGHFVADYTFQPDFIAKYKSRFNSLEAVPWYYVMLSHAMTHGAIVGLITGSVTLSILETVCHFIIDCLKCEKLINIHVDQMLHVACKVAWATLLFWSFV